MINTILNIETDCSVFEDARLVRISDDGGVAPESVGDLFDCEFIIECDGERFKIYGWNASSIEAA